MVKRTVIMTILDGWGIGKNDDTNPIVKATPETINYIKHHYKVGSLEASGIAVGLPWQSASNSQIGHFVMGAGKVVYQNYPRITIAIKNDSFFKNEQLRAACAHAKNNQSSLHFVGLLSTEHVHAHIEHIAALALLAKKEGIPVEKVFLHLFSDGHENGPQTAVNIIDKLYDMFPADYKPRTASITGRFFAMDIDRHWDRTEKTFRTMLGLDGHPYKTSKTGVEKQFEFFDRLYALRKTDDMIPATLFEPDGAIKENDAVIFFNFREVNMRQLVRALINPRIMHPDDPTMPAPLRNCLLTSLVEYSKEFPIAVAFPTEPVHTPLGKTLADNGKLQIRIAETFRYPHITFFFNALQQKPFANEFRVHVPSSDAPHPESNPAMMAEEVTKRAVASINDRIYDFILVNFANADLVAHTQNFDATVAAIKVIDAQLKKIMDAALATNSILIVTSGHSNVEQMYDARTGTANTTDNRNPVPFYVVGKGFESKKDDRMVLAAERENTGMLSDVAPTILELLRLPAPEEMTGVSILSMLT